MTRLHQLLILFAITAGILVGLIWAQDANAKPWRSSVASWYGPGLYGNLTACGQTLTASTIGVAHKTLKCGTLIKFRYHGRTRRARVIDRGPYVAGREFDLTGALRDRLGFPDGVSTVKWQYAYDRKKNR